MLLFDKFKLFRCSWLPAGDAPDKYALNILMVSLVNPIYTKLNWFTKIGELQNKLNNSFWNLMLSLHLIIWSSNMLETSKDYIRMLFIITSDFMPISVFLSVIDFKFNWFFMPSSISANLWSSRPQFSMNSLSTRFSSIFNPSFAAIQIAEFML